MNAPPSVWLIAAGLILFGSFTAAVQIRARRAFRARLLVPSDEAVYFGRRYRRRLITGILIATIGILIGSAYATGLERRADHLGEPKAEANAETPAAKPEMTDEEKSFVRFWAIYWVIVIVLVFAVLFLAFRDAWATRRYALGQFAHIREEHAHKLRRDLAVYKQHKLNASDGGNRVSSHLPGEEL